MTVTRLERFREVFKYGDISAGGVLQLMDGHSTSVGCRAGN